MSIFQKSVKVILVIWLAVQLATFFGLNYPSSAGIIGLLSLLDTRRSTLLTAKRRVLSMTSAMLAAIVCFSLFGLNIWAFGLTMAIYIPMAYKYEWDIGLSVSTVGVFHLLDTGSLALPVILNEIGLFAIGVSLALLANVYMPSHQKEIIAAKDRVELLFKGILLRFHHILSTGEASEEIFRTQQLEKEIESALTLVYRDQSNQLFQRTDYEVHYFEMRMEQCYYLQQMVEDINHCHFSAEESLILAQLFKDTAQQLEDKSTPVHLIDRIDQYLEAFRQRPLPKSREEFESRSMLLQIFRDLERLILLKVHFYERYPHDQLTDE